MQHDGQPKGFQDLTNKQTRSKCKKDKVMPLVYVREVPELLPVQSIILL